MLADKPTELSRIKLKTWTDWAIEDQAKNLNSTARPYDQRAFSPLDPTVSWLSHLALAIYIFVVVNFDALAHASDILLVISIADRQAIAIKSKGDKLCSSAECRIWTWGPRHQILTTIVAETDWAIRTKLDWYTYLLLLIDRSLSSEHSNLNRLSYRGSS